jgi:hypothetical protein
MPGADQMSLTESAVVPISTASRKLEFTEMLDGIVWITGVCNADTELISKRDAKSNGMYLINIFCLGDINP